MRMGSPYPLWLDLIIRKYKSHVESSKVRSRDGKLLAELPVSKGKLACFATVCLFGAIACSTAEREAIVEVIGYYVDPAE